MPNFREIIADAVRDQAERAVGAYFWLTTTVTSLRLSTTAMDLTDISEGGDLEIENIVLKAHGGIEGAGGGFSGPTSFQIVSTNEYGSSVVLATEVTNLGTGMVLDMHGARDLILRRAGTSGLAADITPFAATNVQTILEEGRKLRIKVPAGDSAGTGDGKVNVTVKFRKLNKDSSVSLAGQT